MTSQKEIQAMARFFMPIRGNVTQPNIYLLKLNSKKIEAKSDTCSNATLDTPEARH